MMTEPEQAGEDDDAGGRSTADDFVALEELKLEAAQLVATVKSDPDKWEDATEDALTAFYPGAFFFFDRKCWRMKSDMRERLVKRIKTLIREHPDLTAHFGPGFSQRTFLKKLAPFLKGEASSLLTAAYTRSVLDRIAKHKDAEVSDSLFLKKHDVFHAKPFTVPDNSVYPSLYAANVVRFRRVADDLRRAINDKPRNLSDFVFNDNRPGPNYFKLIINGAGSVERDGKDGHQEWIKPYRFTRYKAQWLHQRLALFCADKKVRLGEFDEMFSDGRGSKPFRTGGVNFSVAMAPDPANPLHSLYEAGKLPPHPIEDR
jgi:hypothetical protein